MKKTQNTMTMTKILIPVFCTTLLIFRHSLAWCGSHVLISNQDPNWPRISKDLHTQVGGGGALCTREGVLHCQHHGCSEILLPFHFLELKSPPPYLHHPCRKYWPLPKKSPIKFCFAKIGVMKTPERWRALPRCALFVSILAEQSSKDVKMLCRE